MKTTKDTKEDIAYRQAMKDIDKENKNFVRYVEKFTFFNFNITEDD